LSAFVVLVGSTLNMAGQTRPWLLAKLIADAQPSVLVLLGRTCREGRRLAEPDLAYYVLYLKEDENPGIDYRCGVCLNHLNGFKSNACALCCNSTICTDCEFTIPVHPHGLLDLDFTFESDRLEPWSDRPEWLDAGNTLCLMCAWHPGLSPQQLRNYHRWVAAGRLFDDLGYDQRRALTM
jgi:hypothetical protein